MKKHTLQPNQKERRFPPFVLHLVFVAVILVIMQVVISNHLIGSGKTVSEIEEELLVIRQENEELRQQIASSSSLLTLGEKAKALGFEKNIHTLFITVESPVAFGPRQ